MIAAVVLQNGQYLIKDEHGNTIHSHPTCHMDVLQGFTSTTYTMLRRGVQVNVYDEHGRNLSSFAAR